MEWCNKILVIHYVMLLFHKAHVILYIIFNVIYLQIASENGEPVFEVDHKGKTVRYTPNHIMELIYKKMLGKSMCVCGWLVLLYYSVVYYSAVTIFIIASWSSHHPLVSGSDCI